MQPYNSPNPGMPINYQQINSNPMTMIPQGPILAWVQGRQGVDNYPLGPNLRGYFFDTNENKFYVKTTDMYGVVQPIRTFNYSEEIQETPQNEQNNYVTRDEIEGIFNDALSSFKKELIDLTNKSTSTTVTKVGGKTNGKRFISGSNESARSDDGSV